MKRILFILLFITSSFIAIPASAQLPGSDPKTALSWAANMMERIADAYLVTRQWRESAMDKARTLGRQADQLVRLRRDYEAKAYGELAGIGRGIPNWKDYSNYCEVEVRGASICSLDTRTQRVIEDVVFGEVTKVQASIFGAMDSVRVQLMAITQEQTGDIIARAESSLTGKSFTRTDVIQERAQHAIAMEALAEKTSQLVEEAVQADSLRGAVSSGRANQISAGLILTEANLELEMTKSSIKDVQAEVFKSKDYVTGVRSGKIALTRFNNL